MTLELSDVRKQLSGALGLISRTAAALKLNATPNCAVASLEAFCTGVERERNAHKTTQPIEILNEGKNTP